MLKSSTVSFFSVDNQTQCSKPLRQYKTACTSVLHFHYELNIKNIKNNQTKKLRLKTSRPTSVTHLYAPLTENIAVRLLFVHTTFNQCSVHVEREYKLRSIGFL